MMYINNIFDVIDRYDAVFCDMNGVLHDGVSLFPNVSKSMEKLIALNKEIVLISNATRTAEMVRDSLISMGIPGASLKKVVTSGDVLRSYIVEGKGVFSELGNEYNFYVFGNPNFLYGLQEMSMHAQINVVDEIYDANCILINGISANISMENNEIMQHLLTRQIPFVCTNPDYVALHGDSFVECPGYVAAIYKNIGGHVYEFGKPHRAMYDFTFEKYPELIDKRILCIGDTLITDVKGAHDYGLDSVLITSGVLRKIKKAKTSISDICAMHGVEPTYYTECFGTSIQ